MSGNGPAWWRAGLWPSAAPPLVAAFAALKDRAPKYERTAMAGWEWMIWSIAGLLLVAAGRGACRAVGTARGSRGLGQSSCPLCAYELAGLEEAVCPECGLDLHEPQVAARFRIGLRRARIAFGALALAAACACAPTVIRQGPLAIVPTTALVLALPCAPGEAEPLHAELRRRVLMDGLSAWQGELLAARCLRVIQSNASPERRAAAAGVLACTRDRSACTARAVAAAMETGDESIRDVLLPLAGDLAREHEPVRTRLLAMVAADPIDRLRGRAVDALRQSNALGRTEMSVLSLATRDGSARVRQRAIYAMQRAPRGWGRTLELVGAAMRDRDESVREAALVVLRHLAQRDTEAVSTLAEGLSDPSPDLRAWTASQLPELGSRAAVVLPALLVATGDDDDAVRSAANAAVSIIVQSSQRSRAG